MMASVSRPRTFKRLPRAVRELQMLDAAVRVFAQRGFHAASMDEIAEDAGISKPMVYAYLGAKEELFVACLRREGTRLMEAVAEAVTVEELAPDEQLWRGIRAYFGFVGAHRDGWRMLRQARGQEPFTEEVTELRRRLIVVIYGVLSRAVAARGLEFREADLEAMAQALLGAGESLGDWLADRPDEDPGLTASRLMNIVWLGADQLLRGQLWPWPAAARAA
jgi:AcrR family transcriptional regulator